MENSHYWLVHALGYWSLAFLIIPFKTFKKLLTFGFIGGFFYTIVVQILAVHVFKKWIFTPDIFTVWEIPVFFILSWTGVIFSYGYLLLHFTKYQVLLVFIYALIAVQMNHFGLTYQMIRLLSWSLLDTFMFGIFSHVLILYLLKALTKKEALGTHQP